MTNTKDILSDFRRKIDKIDDNILQLLKERIDIVKKVGELKTKHADGNSFIRPGREAIMLRRISDNFDNKISKASVTQMWRMIISSAINLEEKTCISALSAPGKDECYWLAREYFGSFTKMVQRPTVMEVLQDVYDKNATVGVIPIWDRDTSRPWWSRICDIEKPPRIFAKLPFVQMAESKKSPLVAIGYVEPEPTGDDESIWVIQSEEKIPFTVLAELMSSIGIEYIHHDTCRILDNPTIHHYLIEIDEFTNEDSEPIKAFIKSANKSFAHESAPIIMHYLGTYAAPIFLDD